MGEARTHSLTSDWVNGVLQHCTWLQDCSFKSYVSSQLTAAGDNFLWLRRWTERKQTEEIQAIVAWRSIKWDGIGWHGDRIEYVSVCLQARQLLKLFSLVYCWWKIKSDDVIKTGVLYFHANMHNAGQSTENRNNSKNIKQPQEEDGCLPHNRIQENL
jgi:hypothetical protein